MRKVKKLLNKLAISFALLGCLTAGMFFASNQPSTQIYASAEFSSPEKISNDDLPEYVDISTSNAGIVGKEIYLFSANSSSTLRIGTDTITNGDYTNYAYYPDKESLPNTYYYFEFDSLLALYYDITNEDIKNNITGENLFAGINNLEISNFAHEHTDPFVPDGYSFTPQQFLLNLKLDTSKSQIEVEDHNVILAKEGCYTLALPVSIYETTNGITFSRSLKTIYYTFMVFNANTYFNNATSRPNITPSTNMQESFANASSAYSNYYFYNYSYGNSINTLPSISYNPERFQLKIEYSDIDKRTSSATIEYTDGAIKHLDANGNEILQEDRLVYTHINSQGNLEITFSQIGSYDISISYLYVSKNAQGSTKYILPLEELKGGTFKNKAQKLYIYGYQTVFSDYSDIDESTNQPKSKPLQTYDLTRGTYSDSADITSALNNYISTTTEKADASSALKYKEIAKRQTATYSSNFDCATLAEYAQEFIQQKDGTQYINNPISSNQTPIKFLTNATLKSAVSGIYSVGEDRALTYKESFQGFNENTAGTYVYIVQYTFDSYLSTSGTLQSGHYHYQVFYFTVTNSTPTISVLELDNSSDVYKYNEIYTNGFTNKSVYVLNDTQNNAYDADVEILLSAQNYKTGEYFFRPTNILNLQSYGFRYQQFEEAPDEATFEEYNAEIAGKYGIMIENTNPYANALFTIQIISANTDKPSTRSFTIDTNPIQNITARNTVATSSINYKILDEFDGFATNQPFILSWDEKPSKAITYGYLKYIPFTSINYYSSLNESNLSQLLSRLITLDTLPVSYKIDLGEASNWAEYLNSKTYNNNIHSTYVKANDGIYILEVYDQAGNSAFKIFMKDSTSPIFVKEVKGAGTLRSLISTGETISVPEPGTDISIKWASKKALFVEDIAEYKNFEAYKFGIDVAGATQKLQTLLADFFELQNNSNLANLSGITTRPVQADPSDEDKIPTGINSYNGTYLCVQINPTTYIKEATSNNYAEKSTSTFSVPLPQNDGEEAIEGTYKILIRDSSNSMTTSNEALSFKQYPSGYLSFNVSSDASKLSLQYESGDLLEYSSYSLTGSLYSYEKEGQTIYTHLPTRIEDASGSPTEEENTETTLTYKFMYNTPINANEAISLTYTPIAENGSKIASIILKYYPFIPEKQKIGSNYYHYYTIAENASRTIKVFPQSSKVYAPGEEETFNIALGADDYPLAGRYVIERIYKEGNATDQFDYFKRTISFVVDDFSLISPVESVEGETGKTSLESLVGGDIILSMYSGEGLSSLEVSFPSYNENGLNVGSFYTKESFTENELLSVYSVEGNKLPMMLYIPERKFTVSTSEAIKSNKKEYSVSQNNNLSYYGQATVKLNDTTGFYDVIVEGLVVKSFATEELAWKYIENNISIAEYKIMAKIEAVIYEGGKPITKYFASQGESANGFLRLYPADKFGVVADGAVPVEFFWQRGNYAVTIYQASNDNQSKFYSLYKFGFKIISQEPDFTISDAGGYDLEPTRNSNSVFYTNSNELTISWKLPKNKYQAEIDEDKIEITSFPNHADIVKGEIKTGTDTKYFTINTTELVESTNGYLTITMQYKAHSSYYTKVTKTVYFDRTAPTQTLHELMYLTETATGSAFPVNYQQYYMRKYYDYNNQIIDTTKDTDLTKASYSYSIDNKQFKYYSYNVTTEFFTKTLKTAIANADTNPYETQYVYFKPIADFNSYLQVDKLSFSERNGYELIEFDYQPEIFCGYYEVVELDYAGNMTVYIVYVIDSSDPTDANVNDNAIAYSNNLHLEETTLSNNQIQDGFNIYSNSGFTMTSLSYKSDPWAMIKVSLAGQAQTIYMKSPELENDSIYKLTFSASGVKFDPILLADIFRDVNSSSNKHQLVFTDRTSGTSHTAYLSIMDASLNTQKIEDPAKTSAILNIAIPSQSEFNSTSECYVYPTSITIYQYQYNGAIGQWGTILIADQKGYGIWEARTEPEDYSTAMEYINFKLLSSNTLQVAVHLGQNASQKIKYEITDNFGNKTSVIQLANEVSYKEIAGNSSVYAFTESDNSTTYISSDTIRYSFNILLYSVKIFDQDGNDITSTMNSLNRENNASTNISVFSFNKPDSNIYDIRYKLEIRDVEDEGASDPKVVHVRIVYNLPYLTFTPAEVNLGGLIFNNKNQQPISSEDINNVESLTVHFNGRNYTSSAYAVSSYDNITVKFKDGQDYAYDGKFAYQKGFSYSLYLSKDNGLTWENINSETSASGGYTIREVGEYIILAIYDDQEIFQNLCKIFTVSVIDQDLFPLYSIRVDNLPVSKSNLKFTSKDNIEYEVNYIVSVNFYLDKANRLTIIENDDKEVTVTRIDHYPAGNNVYVEIYHYVSAKTYIEGDFTIIYIEENNNFVSTFTYNTAAGTSVAIKDASYVMVAADKETEINFDKLKINFNAYYGIKENKINVEVLKLFDERYVAINSKVEYNGENAFIYLEKAGSYRIKLYDSCSPANVQKFRTSNYIEIVFLNSVPFTVSHISETGEEIKTEPIQRAVYNSAVKIELQNLYSNSYYQTSGYPQITVKRNGKLTDDYTEANRIYTFTTPGIYTVKFSAISKTNYHTGLGVQIREEEFSFSIITKNEIKSSYEFSEYSNYYIEKVEKDGVDITEDLVSMGNYKTMRIDNKNYLVGLSLANSIQDEKTGDGRYTITVNPNIAGYENVIGERYSYQVRIGHISQVPINVSISEGSSTTSPITVSFNVKNLFDTVGDCYLLIGDVKRYYTEETLADYEEIDLLTISGTGTHYIKLYTVSGRLVYSYKVTKTEPLNAFAIIAIIIGVCAFGAIIGITIKIRKRQRAK